MPKVRINPRELDEIEDLAEELDEREQREGRHERAREEKGKRPISPLALERRQAQRKFGQDVARMMRERKSQKP
jgi:hypothetical protein